MSPGIGRPRRNPPAAGIDPAGTFSTGVILMKKLALVLVALVLGAAVLPGCRVEGEVDDDVRTNVGVAR